METLKTKEGWGWCFRPWNILPVCPHTTLQFVLIAKNSQQSFSPCPENGLIKTITTMSNNLFVDFNSGFFYRCLQLQVFFSNSQKGEANMKVTYRLWGFIGILLNSPFSRHGWILCWLSLDFTANLRVVPSEIVRLLISKTVHSPHKPWIIFSMNCFKGTHFDCSFREKYSLIRVRSRSANRLVSLSMQMQRGAENF